MRQLLCLVDLTASSGRVLDVAARIAHACGLHLTVLYTYRLISDEHTGDLTALKRKIESTAKEKFEKLISECQDNYRMGYSFQTEIGFISDRIYANVTRNGVDMIVIGQEQAEAANDIRSFNLQQMIKSLQLPFVIVPAEKVEAA